MTARFERLSISDNALLIALVSVMAIFLFPGMADAAENKTSFISEIKNFKIINVPAIPTAQTIATAFYGTAESGEQANIAAKTVVAQPIAPVSIDIQEVKPLGVTAKTVYQVPPKKVGDERVYMHEPEIRAYVCPKLGDKCNIFIAILKAENGSHECTRDNRGLNRNGSIDIGLTQINWTPNSPYSFEQLQDCKFNLDIALKKYETRGFQPWAAYNSGRYKRHLPAVLASAAKLEAAAIAEAAVVSTLTIN